MKLGWTRYDKRSFRASEGHRGLAPGVSYLTRHHVYVEVVVNQRADLFRALESTFVTTQVFCFERETESEARKAKDSQKTDASVKI